MGIKKYFLIIFFCQLATISFSKNNKLDSLFLDIKKNDKKCLQPCPSDSNIAISYLNIGDLFEYENPDTAKYFYKKALEISKIIKNKRYEAKSLLYIGQIIEGSGDYTQPLSYYFKAINLLLPLNDTKNIASCYNSIGSCFYNQGDFQKAIENMLRALNYYEEMHKNASNSTEIYDSQRGICASLSNIGCVNTDMGNYKSALKYHNKALNYYLELSKSKNDIEKTFGKRGISICYINIGNVNYYKNNLKLALDNYKKALKLKKELNDIQGICLANNNIGNIYAQMGEYAQAIETYQNSLTSYKEINDKSGLSLITGNISALYIMLSDSMAYSTSAKEKYLNKALEFGIESYNIAKNINSIPQISESSYNLKNAYKKLGNLSKAIYFYDIYIETKDSMYQEEKTRSIAEMETKYQSEKQQLQIDNYQKTNLLNLSKIKQQKILLYSFIIGFILILIFSFWLIKLYKAKKKANTILNVQNKEIKQQKEEISTQRDEIETQRDLVLEQKLYIENIHEEVTSSIRYAKRIQGALMTAKIQLNDVLSEYFIFFKPRDIVSGDFFWATKVKKWLIFCVADCTGHGVPGAFMSMLGISFLNEIVRKEEVTNAAEVLNQLRKNIITSLNQTYDISRNSSDVNVDDGMDISLCVLNTETLKLQFAGANNPLYIIRKLKAESCKVETQSFENNELSNLKNFELYELKGNKMPIAIHIHMESFTLQETQLQKDDLLYLFSDGYADQFGGLNNKKFRYKAFKELLISNSNKSLNEQKTILESNFENWKGNNKQVDDVTIMGVKI